MYFLQYRMPNLAKIIEGLESSKNIEEKYAEILDILEKDGQNIILTEPQIFLKMVQQAWFFMLSPAYHGIVQVN